jgi:hypothetical protein
MWKIGSICTRNKTCEYIDKGVIAIGYILTGLLDYRYQLDKDVIANSNKRLDLADDSLARTSN